MLYSVLRKGSHQVFVIPANAGIHTQPESWIPAVVYPAQVGAGMTRKHQKTSFPQHSVLRQESIWVFVIPANAGIHTQPERWIPACAGMTRKHRKTSFPQHSAKPSSGDCAYGASTRTNYD
jgi:hypothetical protein